MNKVPRRWLSKDASQPPSKDALRAYRRVIDRLNQPGAGQVRVLGSAFSPDALRSMMRHIEEHLAAEGNYLSIFNSPFERAEFLALGVEFPGCKLLIQELDRNTGEPVSEPAF